MADSTQQEPLSLEKGEAVSKVLSADVSPSPPQPDFPTDAHLGRGEIEVIRIRQGNAILRKLKATEEWMDRKLGVESTGAERVREDQRRPPHILNMMLLWFSMLMSPGLITMGMLGPLLGLSVNESIGLSDAATVIGSVIPGFTATLCAPLGLRQIAVSRYAFGIWGAKICGLLNIIVNIGFGTVNCIVAGQLQSAVSGGSLTIVVGIVIVCIGSFLVSFCGFRWIQKYESVAWFLILVFLCVQFGQAARYFSPTPALSSVAGLDRTGAALTYFAIVFGEASAWCSLAGDYYYVHYPPSINKWLVFGMTWTGLTIPTVFVLILGNYYGGIVVPDSKLSDAYNYGRVGALILATMSPSGWAKFVCVMYSGKQHCDHLLNTLLAAIMLALAWGGRSSLEAILENFLALLGYWTICFGTILAIEAFWFRRRLGGYDIEGWQDQSRMPWGLAGCGSLALGIGVSFLGMNQTWYVGPVARLIGSGGGDVGKYFTLVAVLISYPILGTIEIDKFSR
ncbi:hypothetical protein M409DRAFT_36272 [Zasmidium cellare ATCC 36951]|uniref:Nucleoside transporter n=1 Tax=Zasmidium cellare ATCC 36951 TaxID=1080233 RepID=A0A6A6CS44_ZASCE|nr:uncharacterized protein M409DRAFT_36272 [Zasmidium cellare ATCC 36951]KAF2168970.1 hypothetical protein M409DRAFT_36272 [Zasmidium cellare ATCC 36951]